MNPTHIDLIVENVPAAATFLRDVAGLKLHELSERFAELRSDTLTVMLSPDAMVPVGPARGIILHFRTENIQEAFERAKEKGAEIALEPTMTPWGWEQIMVSGPEEILINFYRVVT